jgi:hypothetical protein
MRIMKLQQYNWILFIINIEYFYQFISVLVYKDEKDVN